VITRPWHSVWVGCADAGLRALGRAGRDRVAVSFSIRAMVERYENLYDRVLATDAQTDVTRASPHCALCARPPGRKASQLTARCKPSS
jgi:hypothetical protein